MTRLHYTVLAFRQINGELTIAERVLDERLIAPKTSDRYTIHHGRCSSDQDQGSALLRE